MAKKRWSNGDELSDAERCKRNDGKGWRCSKPRVEERTLCEYHMQYSRTKIKKASAVKSKGERRVIPSSGRKDRKSSSEEESDGDESNELKRLKKWGKSLKKAILVSDEESSEEAPKVLQKNDFRRKRSLMKKVLEEKRDLESSDGSGSQEASVEKSDEDESSKEVPKVLQKNAFRRKRNLMKKVLEERRDLESSDGSGSQEEAYVEKSDEDESSKEVTKVLQKNAFRRKRSLMKKVLEERRDLESSDGSGSQEEAFVEKQNNDDDYKLGEKQKTRGEENAEKRRRKSRNLIDSKNEPSSAAEGSNNNEMREGSRMKPLKGEDALLCHQCQRNDKGWVVWCLDCMKKRHCVQFIERCSEMKRAASWEQIYTISSDDSSDLDSDDSSDSDSDDGLINKKGGTENGGSRSSKGIMSDGALIRRAKIYQEYMKEIPIPNRRGSLIPFTSWQGLAASLKLLYNQPLHYLTNTLLSQWDRARIGSEPEHQPLDSVIHPVKAEAIIFVTEEVHRVTSSHHHLAKLWASDPMFEAYIDSIFPST